MSLTPVVSGSSWGRRICETDNNNSLGKETEKGDTFRCANMLLRKSLKAPTTIPRPCTQVQAVHNATRCSGGTVHSGRKPITPAVQKQDL